jgi:hypothetical protein
MDWTCNTLSGPTKYKDGQIFCKGTLLKSKAQLRIFVTIWVNKWWSIRELKWPRTEFKIGFYCSGDEPSHSQIPPYYTASVLLSWNYLRHPSVIRQQLNKVTWTSGFKFIFPFLGSRSYTCKWPVTYSTTKGSLPICNNMTTLLWICGR